MGDASKVEIGVCNVEFDAVDLGFTKGFVKVKYGAETYTIEVDQMDTPVDEVIKSQTFEVEVPMAEKDLSRLADILPGTKLTTGTGADAGKYKLEMSGASSGSLLDLGKKLILKPVGGTEHDWLTVFKAVPVPSMDFTYDKENVRVYTVTFKAVPDPDSTPANRWVMWGKDAIITA